MEKVSDELAEVRVVGLLLEAERAAVVQVSGKLSYRKENAFKIDWSLKRCDFAITWLSFAQLVNWRR